MIGALRLGALRVPAIALAILAGASGVAAATTVLEHTSTTVIQACEKLGSGRLRIVNSPAQCRHDETAISWNVEGPAGATGATGATGPAGATVPAGTSGATGSQGAAGSDGATGTAGAVGPTGPLGPQGVTGPPGAGGDAGATGPSGPMGATGPSGSDPNADAFVGRFANDTNQAAAGNGETCTLGQILLSASTYVTVGGVPANGQLMAISQNEALFALIGTTYGGDGVTTFALPDLRGLAPSNMTYSICDVGVFPSRRYGLARGRPLGSRVATRRFTLRRGTAEGRELWNESQVADRHRCGPSAARARTCRRRAQRRRAARHDRGLELRAVRHRRKRPRHPRRAARPHVGGLALSLQQRHGAGWYTIGAATAGANGAFSFTTHPKTPGFATYRVAAKGTGYTGDSSPVPVQIVRWSYLSNVYVQMPRGAEKAQHRCRQGRRGDVSVSGRARRRLLQRLERQRLDHLRPRQEGRGVQGDRRDRRRRTAGHDGLLRGDRGRQDAGLRQPRAGAVVEAQPVARRRCRG